MPNLFWKNFEETWIEVVQNLLTAFSSVLVTGENEKVNLIQHWVQIVVNRRRAILSLEEY